MRMDWAPQSWIAVQFRIRGRSLEKSFLAFVAEKARRLSLDGWAALPRTDEITVVVSGPEALVDMLEVACMLGPLDAFVDAIDRVELPESFSPSAGFTVTP